MEPCVNCDCPGTWLTWLADTPAICVIGCIVKPMNFDFDIMIAGIKLVGGDGGENSKVLGSEWESRPEFLQAAQAWIFKYGWGYTVFLCIIWPTFCIPWGVFGKSSFQLWAAVAMCCADTSVSKEVCHF